MDFTYQELAILNKMISIALISGKITFNEASESIHKKVADEICRRTHFSESADKEEKG